MVKEHRRIILILYHEDNGQGDVFVYVLLRYPLLTIHLKVHILYVTLFVLGTPINFTGHQTHVILTFRCTLV